MYQRQSFTHRSDSSGGGDGSGVPYANIKPPHRLGTTYTHGDLPAAVNRSTGAHDSPRLSAGFTIAATLPALSERVATSAESSISQRLLPVEAVLLSGSNRSQVSHSNVHAQIYPRRPPPPPQLIASTVSVRSGTAPLPANPRRHGLKANGGASTAIASAALVSTATRGTRGSPLDSKRNTAARRDGLATVRHSHRLRSPADALLLPEPARLAKQVHPAQLAFAGIGAASNSNGGVSASLSRQGLMFLCAGGMFANGEANATGTGTSPTDGSPRRRRQRQDRSFLPEDVRAREEAAKVRAEQAAARAAQLERRAARAARRAQRQRNREDSNSHCDEDKAENERAEGSEGMARRVASPPLDDGAESNSKSDGNRSASAATLAGHEDEHGERKTGFDRDAAGSLSTLSETIPSSISHGDHSDADGYRHGSRHESRAYGEDGDGEYDDDVETVQERKARLEREVMAHYNTMYARRSAAARRIQCAWRCSRARVALYNRRQVLYRFVYTRQKAAAACLVGALKAFALRQQRRRQRMQMRAQEGEWVDKEHDTEVTRGQLVSITPSLATTTTTTTTTAAAAAVDAVIATPARAANERRIIASVHTIERAVAAWLARVREKKALEVALAVYRSTRLERYAAAAVLVQRWWRIAPAQRAYWQRRNEAVAAEHAAAVEQMKRDGAAARIQARVRGIRDRREVHALRLERTAAQEERQRQLQRGTDVVAAILKEFTLRQVRVQREQLEVDMKANEAVATIQRGWRQALERRRLDEAVSAARLLRRSAEAIQRCWRRFIAGRERRYLRRLQHTVERDRIDGELSRYRGAVCLQRFVRHRVLRQRHERLARAAYGARAYQALAQIQRVGRGYLGRKHGGHLRIRDEKVAVARALWERDTLMHTAELAQQTITVCRQLYTAYSTAMAHEAELAELHVHARNELRYDEAVAIIQRAWRRSRTRREQTADRMVLERAKTHVWNAVVTAQRVWRGSQGRQEAACRRCALVNTARRRQEWEEVQMALEDDALKAAVVKASAKAVNRGASSNAQASEDAQVASRSANAAVAVGATGPSSAWTSIYDDDVDSDALADENS